ncbi:MAG TPA: hypothetical protein DD621_00205 [Clostridiales bacterium]|nr:hypothetical protein [Clostridiales bacterium]
MAYISKRKTLYIWVFLAIAVFCAAIALFVVFVMPKTAIVSFADNVADSIEVKKGDVLPLLDTPSKYGHYFDNWYYSRNFDENTIAKPGEDIINGDVTIYAHFIKGTFTVSFDANDGEGVVPAAITDVFDNPFTFPKDDCGLTKTDQELKGWALDKNYVYSTFNEDMMELGSEGKIPGENCTYYAVWGEPMSTIKYVTGDGVGFMADRTFPRGSKVPEDAQKLADGISKTGHTFGGWYISEEFTPDNKIDFEHYTLDQKEVQFFAYWIPYKYTVNFYVNGVLYGLPQTINYGEKITRPAIDPTMENKMFVGWFRVTDGGFDFEMNFDNAITEIRDGLDTYVINIQAKFGDIPTPDNETKLEAFDMQSYSVTKPNGDVVNGYIITGLKDDYKSETSIIIPRRNNDSDIIAIKSNFTNATSLTQIIMQSSILEIQDGAFNNCPALSTIGFYEGFNSYFKIKDGVLFGMANSSDTECTKLICYPASRGGADYSTPADTEVIANYAFAYTKYLDNVTLNATRIGGNIFNYSVVKNVVLGSKVSDIDDSTFTQSSIVSGVISSITSNSANYVVENFALYNSTKTKLYKYYNCSSVADFVATSTLQEIMPFAFNGTKVGSVELGADCYKIGTGAFMNCISLKTIRITTAQEVVDENGKRFNNESSRFSKVLIPTVETIYVNSSNPLYTVLSNDASFKDKLQPLD